MTIVGISLKFIIIVYKVEKSYANFHVHTERKKSIVHSRRIWYENIRAPCHMFAI